MTAIASSFKDVPVDPGVVVFGEVGLSGEVRGVSRADVRVVEAERLGFKRCIIPKRNASQLGMDSRIEVIGASTIRDVLDLLIC